MNIIEYVKKYGGRTFGEAPLTEVDSLILSELSYLNYRGLVPGHGFGTALGELKGASKEMSEDAVHPREGRLLLEAACGSVRFSSLRVGYFREVNDDRLPERFAAVSFLFEDGSIYVAFRGTDVTIAAWHEDFDLLFLNAIPSQREAKKYLSDVMRAEEGAFFVGGHSKGGNLAVYAAATVSAKMQARVLTVFDHDGPGFGEAFFESPGYLAIKERVLKTVPHDSLVGMLLMHTDRYRVVKSRKKLLGQHNPFAWEVDETGDFRTLAALSPISRRAEAALRGWIMGMDLKSRKLFVTALFKVIGATGAQKVADLSKRRLRNYLAILKAYRALPERERLLVKRGGGVFLRIWLRVVRSTAKGAAPKGSRT